MESQKAGEAEAIQGRIHQYRTSIIPASLGISDSRRLRSQDSGVRSSSMAWSVLVCICCRMNSSSDPSIYFFCLFILSSFIFYPVAMSRVHALRLIS